MGTKSRRGSHQVSDEMMNLRVNHARDIIAIPKNIIDEEKSSRHTGNKSDLSSSHMFNIVSMLNSDLIHGFRPDRATLHLSRITTLMRTQAISNDYGRELIRSFYAAYKDHHIHDRDVEQIVKDARVQYLIEVEPEDLSPLVRTVFTFMILDSSSLDTGIIAGYQHLYHCLNNHQRNWSQVLHGGRMNSFFQRFYRWVNDLLLMGSVDAKEAMMIVTAKDPLKTITIDKEMVNTYHRIDNTRDRFLFARFIASLFIDDAESVVDFDGLVDLLHDEQVGDLPFSIMKRMSLEEHRDTYLQVRPRNMDTSLFNQLVPMKMVVPQGLTMTDHSWWSNQE